MLRFDPFVYIETDGRMRLLFEEGSSYIYVWITPEFEIAAFQYLISGRTGLQYHVTGTIKTNDISTQPFNRALTGASAFSNEDAIEQLSKFTSLEFPFLIPMLVGLAKKTILKGVFPPAAVQLISK